jgi:putative flippase GtrA
MTRRIAWFVAVGCTAAAVHLGTVMLLVSQLGWAPLVANVAGWMVAFCFSFAGHWHLTFPRSGAPLTQAAMRFMLVSFCGFAINEALYAVMLHFIGTAWYAVVLFFVLIAVAVMTYLLRSRWAFRGTAAP